MIKDTYELPRIIPTRMGTRNNCSATTVLKRDHPHAYGDKFAVSRIPSITLGSSPRVWGQASEIACKKADKRIIPTRMGTRLHHELRDLLTEDHPHAYGDKVDKLYVFPLTEGSSPRVWGQVYLVTSSRSALRIIPTRMGTSQVFDFWYALYEDHPHAYGDKVMAEDIR